MAHRIQRGSDLQVEHVVLVELLQALGQVVPEHRCISHQVPHHEEDGLELGPDRILVCVSHVGVLGHQSEISQQAVRTQRVGGGVPQAITPALAPVEAPHPRTCTCFPGDSRQDTPPPQPGPPVAFRLLARLTPQNEHPRSSSPWRVSCTDLHPPNSYVEP